MDQNCNLTRGHKIRELIRRIKCRIAADKIATYFGFHICSAIHSSGLFLIVAVAVGRGIREFDKVRSFSNPVRDSALRNSRFSLSF